MVAKLTEEESAIRRERILSAARWCFLHFGFSKTSLDDIARRASISRTLLYKTFRNKEDIFTAVFTDWLVARHPRALKAAAGPGSTHDRLLEVCRVLLVETWNDMVGAPMATEFYDICERLDPETAARHRWVSLQCLIMVLEDEDAAEVFLLALDGLVGDEPTTEVFDRRIQLLAAQFAPPVAAAPSAAASSVAAR